MIKPGDKVRIIGNFGGGRHPIKDRPLVAGDIVTVTRVDDTILFYSVKDAYENYVWANDVEVVKEEFTFVISNEKGRP